MVLGFCFSPPGLQLVFPEKCFGCETVIDPVMSAEETSSWPTRGRCPQRSKVKKSNKQVIYQEELIARNPRVNAKNGKESSRFAFLRVSAEQLGFLWFDQQPPTRVPVRVNA